MRNVMMLRYTNISTTRRISQVKRMEGFRGYDI